MRENERKAVVLAMEILARNINDEEVFDAWLMGGIPDGDIIYSDALDWMEEASEKLVDYYYAQDDVFSDLLACFLRCMKKAYYSGGLYCDGVVDSNGIS